MSLEYESAPAQTDPNAVVSNDPKAEPLIGTVVHNYVVRRKLAEGGMGAVYVADHQDRRSTAKKAIKILLPEFSRHPVIRERFEQEALAVMGVKNPYIVKIDNFGTLPDGQLYLVMELLEGETLEEHIRRRGRASQHHTLHVLAQIMSALQSLHEAGLVHRDLKPANIFIVRTEQNQYEVRLIDLGIARKLSPTEAPKKTITGMAMGTPGYMAVEQYENAAGATTAADVYAAAVVAWHMLLAQPPWGDIHDERVLYFKQRTEDFELPTDHGLSAELIGLLRDGLSREPEQRPSVASFISRFASYTPAIPPFVPSGARILERVAPKFITNASAVDETVRNVSHGDIAPSAHWPHRATQTPAQASQPATQPPSTAVTANDRPAVSGRTTLTGSSGVIDTPLHRPAPRWRYAVFGLAACVIAAIATFSIVHVTRSSGAGASGLDHDVSPDAQIQLESANRSALVDAAPSVAPVTAATVEGTSASATGSGSSAPVVSPNSESSTPSGKTAHIDPSPRTKRASVDERTGNGAKKFPAKPFATPASKVEGSAPGSAAPPRVDVPFDPNAVVE